MTQVKLNAVPISQLQDTLIGDGTKVDTGVVKRHLASLTWLSQNIGRTLPKEDVEHALRVANLIGYPNQALGSQQHFASRCMASWKRAGAIEVVI
jgi:hypothetical protein